MVETAIEHDNSTATQWRVATLLQRFTGSVRTALTSLEAKAWSSETIWKLDDTLEFFLKKFWEWSDELQKVLAELKKTASSWKDKFDAFTGNLEEINKLPEEYRSYAYTLIVKWLWVYDSLLNAKAKILIKKLPSTHKKFKIYKKVNDEDVLPIDALDQIIQVKDEWWWRQIIERIDDVTSITTDDVKGLL